jgi:integrase
MKDVGKQQRLWLRGSTYYLRVKVPEKIQSIIGRREIRESLGTGVYKDAAELSRAASARVDAQFAAARRKLTASTTPRTEVAKRTDVSKHEIEQMARLWLHSAEIQHQSEAIADGAMTAEERDQARVELANEFGALRSLDTKDDPDGLIMVQGVIGRLMKEHEIVLEPTDPSYKLLFSFVRRAMMENVQRRKHRLEIGHDNTAFDALFGQVFADAAVPQPSPNQSLTVAELITRYQMEPDHVRLAKGTKDKYATITRLMKETFGANTPIRDLTLADFKKVRALLMVIPANATKLYRGKTFAEAAELAKKDGRPPMNPSTATNHIQFMSAIFAYAVAEELLDKNRAAGLSVPRDEELPDEEKRNPFTTAELRVIFDAPLYRGCENDEQGYKRRGPNVIRRGRFWVSPISLFSGMRLNEICQLLTTDVAERDGVHIFINRTSNDEEKKLKTVSSRRIIPVHPELVRLGFLDFVAEKRKAGEKYLFPELRTSKVDRHSSTVSKWYHRFLVSVGIKRPDITFHSLRHTWRDGLRRAHTPPGIEDALGGWTAGKDENAKSTYGAGYPPAMLAAEVEKISFPLDLSHLYPRR